MRIEDSLVVRASAEEVWNYFLQLDRVVRCVPGATDVQQTEEREWTGKVRVKLGPMTLAFVGRLTMSQVDEASKTLVLKGSGRDEKGKGAASATVTVRVTGDRESADVGIVQDLTVTGPIAQFGRGVMQDVSTRLVGEFARCLQQTIDAELARPAANGSAPCGPCDAAAAAQFLPEAQAAPPASRDLRAGMLLLAALAGLLRRSAGRLPWRRSHPARRGLN